MATLSKPTKTPRWADTGTRVEPAEAKKDSGWVFEDEPPYSFFNWIDGITGDWIKWIDERIDDGATIDEIEIHASDGLSLPDGKLEVGETAANADKVIALADSGSAFGFQMGFVNGLGVDPQINFDTNDAIQYDRSSDELRFVSQAVRDVTIGNQGIQIGFVGTPAANRFQLGDASFSLDHPSPSATSTPTINFDPGDFIAFDRFNNFMDFIVGGLRGRFTASGLNVVTGGLIVGFAGTPVNNSILVGDVDSAIDFSGSGGSAIVSLHGDKAIGTRLEIGRTSDDFKLFSAGSEEFRFLPVAGNPTIELHANDGAFSYIRTGAPDKRYAFDFTGTEEIALGLFSGDPSIEFRNSDTFWTYIDGGYRIETKRITAAGEEHLLTTTTGENARCVSLQNVSGGLVSSGALVISPGTGLRDFTTGSTLSDTRVLGVLMEDTADNAFGPVAISGMAVVNTSAAITVGQHCVHANSTAVAGNTATPAAGASIGVYVGSLSGNRGVVVLR